MVILLFNAFFLYLVILLIASFSGLISERAGIVNIAINGMMIIGATFYGIFSVMFRSSNMWLEIPLTLIAALFGAMFAALHGYATIKLKANHIISGVAINILAAALAIMLLQLVGVGNKFEMPTRELAAASTFSPLNIISFKVFLGLFITLVMWFALNKTKWGLRIKSIGENPQAADVAGINVNRYKWQAVLISGVLAGIAGGIFAQSLGSTFTGNVQGLGFLALAIMIMGQWRVSWITLSSIVFSFLYALGFNLINLQGSISNYARLFQLLPFALTLISLAIFSKKSKMPKADGIPYDKSIR